jgi:hypothetical protein
VSQHDPYLDRVTARLGEIESEIKGLSQQAGREGGPEPHQVRELEASLAVVKERLRSLRRAGAELDDEMTRSFAQSFERLQAAVARARSPSGDGRPDAAA